MVVFFIYFFLKAELPGVYCFLFLIMIILVLQHSYRYEEVIQACTLDVDISAMVGGDMSRIGEKGLNLSGGQKARLALARSYLKHCAVEIGKSKSLCTNTVIAYLQGFVS